MALPYEDVKFALQVCAWLVGLPLYLLVISAMLRRAYREFPLLFLFALVNFLTTIAEIPSALALHSHVLNADKWLANWYWGGEVVAQVLLYAIVMGFIYQATARLSSRVTIRLTLVFGAIAFAGISFWLHWHAHSTLNLFMTRWTRDLSFCSAILDLALWTLLISSREKDHRLLMLSGALGIQFTGEAIGEAVVNLSLLSPPLSHAIYLSGVLISTLADFACTYIWWQVFRAREPRHSKSAVEPYRARH